MVSRIHNVAVAGHGTCGKTTLVEELLALGKAIARAGKVEDGSSILDHDAEERDRGFTIDASSGCISTHEGQLNVIDTPGYPDFLGAVVDSFSAVETAVIAVDGVNGIRVNTRRCWEEARKAGLARLVVVTRLDLDSADYEARLSEIRETFGSSCVPLYLPNTSGPEFSAVESTYRVGDASSDRAREINGQLIESVIEADEALMERYLGEEEISPDEIDAVFTTAVSTGAVVPVLVTSARKGIGISELLESLTVLAPNHDVELPRPLVDDKGETVEGTPVGSPDDPFLARAFKVVGDPFVGKLSYLRIYAGTARPNMHVVNLSRNSKERLTSILRMQGKDQEHVDSAGPGEIIAVPKLDSIHIGDTVGESGGAVRLAPVPHPRSMVKLAVEPKNRNDETKIWEALTKLSEGDSTFRAERIAQTHELVISGRSSLHLEVMLSRLKRRFDLEVNTHIPRTSYLESILSNSEAHYKHKKQTGGRGQFGEVNIRLEKAPEGTSLEFVDAIVGGVIPNQFIPAVEKGIRETMAQGILASCPVVGVKVTLYDGSFHQVDSSEAAFKTAGREAFKKAFMEANPCLLEPIVNMEVHVPAQFLGDVMSDLNGRRASISGMDSDGDDQIIRAVVPEAEIKRYSIELRSLTGGEGSYSLEFSHYDVVPAHQQQVVIKEMEAAAEEAAN